MAIPVHVEPLETLRGRYAAAVKHVYVSEDIAQGRVTRPGQQRKHVFDLDNGVRLIVSHERFLDGRVGVHFSGSFHDPVRAASVAAGEPSLMDPVEASLKMVYRAWCDVAQSQRPCEYIGMSQAQVQHFFVQDAS